MWIPFIDTYLLLLSLIIQYIINAITLHVDTNTEMYRNALCSNGQNEKFYNNKMLLSVLEEFPLFEVIQNKLQIV